MRTRGPVGTGRGENERHGGAITQEPACVKSNEIIKIQGRKASLGGGFNGRGGEKTLVRRGVMAKGESK